MGIDLDVGEGGEPSRDPRPWGRMRVVFEAVDELLDPEDGNPAAREARRALLERGASEESVRYRIGRLYLAVVWHFSERPEKVAEAGGPDAFVEEAFERLGDGEPPSAIFPDLDALRSDTRR